jgi:DNA replication protein DnaC
VVSTAPSIVTGWPPRATRLPSRYHDRTLDGFDPSVSPAAKAGLAAARRLLAGDIRNLVLIGPPGAGKTHLAAGIARVTWERGRADWARRSEAAEADGYRLAEPPVPWWVNVPELIAGMRRDIAAGQTDHVDDAGRAGRHPGLVVLDDAGRENITEFSGEAIYVLVNRRYEAMRPTVMTSNLGLAELDAGGFGPVVSRLAEDGALVEMATAVDYRFRHGKRPGDAS